MTAAGKPAIRRVTMLLYSDVTYDNRVLREARTLVEDGFEVTIVTPFEPRRPMPEITDQLRIAVRDPAAVSLPGGVKPRSGGVARSVRWALDYGGALRRWGAAVRREFDSTDVWHAHDLTGLIALAAGGKLDVGHFVYDSHELYLESGAAGKLPEPVVRGLRAYEGRWARRASAVITVNEGVAGELERRYRVAPTVVMNCPPRPPDTASAEPPRPGVLRRTFGLGDRPIALYHGALAPNRGVEAFLASMDRLPADLAFVVIGEGPLTDAIRRDADGDRQGRLFWHPMITPGELRPWLEDADIGLVLLEPDRLNHVLATPNRLFEYLNAGVAILASDLPELRRILAVTGAGVTCDPLSPASIAEGVAHVLRPGAALAMRQAGLTAARGVFDWETQSRVLLDVYHRVLAAP